MKHIPNLKEYHLINGIVKVKISDLKTDHLYNIIMLWKRKAKGGTVWLAPPMDDGKGNFCEEYDEFYFNVSMSDNLMVNQGEVTASVSTSLQEDGDYKIFAVSIYTPDGSPINYYDDNGEQQTLNANPYLNEEDNILLNDLFHIAKNTSNLADNYNGTLSINKKYVLFPENTRIDAILKISSSTSNSQTIKYNVFSQTGEEEPEIELGDINADLTINILDVVTLINLIIDSPTQDNLTQEEFDRADINGDGTLNVQDMVNLISIILGG